MKNFKIIVFTVALLFLIRCKEKAPQENLTNDTVHAADNSSSVSATDPPDGPESVALSFINAYIENLEGETTEITEWIDNNFLVTQTFRDELHKLMDQETDLEGGGLDYNPILNAQDYPEEGFELVSFDDATGYVTVVGKKWKDFKVKLRLVKAANGEWLVDGSGVINIPDSERITP